MSELDYFIEQLEAEDFVVFRMDETGRNGIDEGIEAFQKEGMLVFGCLQEAVELLREMGCTVTTPEGWE